MSARDGTVVETLVGGIGSIDKIRQSIIVENESKKLLLTPGSSIYCDETWVDTKVKDKNGKIHYQKRYMWVIVNMTTKVCCYMLYVQSSQAQGYRRIS